MSFKNNFFKEFSELIMCYVFYSVISFKNMLLNLYVSELLELECELMISVLSLWRCVLTYKIAKVQTHVCLWLIIECLRNICQSIKSQIMKCAFYIRK